MLRSFNQGPSELLPPVGFLGPQKHLGHLGLLIQAASITGGMMVFGMRHGVDLHDEKPFLPFFLSPRARHTTTATASPSIQPALRWCLQTLISGGERSSPVDLLTPLIPHRCLINCTLQPHSIALNANFLAGWTAGVLELKF